MALQFPLEQIIGSYMIGGRSGLSFKGVYKQLTGTTYKYIISEKLRSW